MTTSAGTKVVPGSKFLCQAWGESDLPMAYIANNRADVERFFVDEWMGDKDAPELPEAMQRFDEHDWSDGELDWEFEIGGVSVKLIFESTPRAGDTSAPVQAGELVKRLRYQLGHLENAVKDVCEYGAEHILADGPEGCETYRSALEWLELIAMNSGREAMHAAAEIERLSAAPDAGSAEPVAVIIDSQFADFGDNRIRAIKLSLGVNLYDDDELYARPPAPKVSDAKIEEIAMRLVTYNWDDFQTMDAVKELCQKAIREALELAGRK